HPTTHIDLVHHGCPIIYEAPYRVQPAQKPPLRSHTSRPKAAQPSPSWGLSIVCDSSEISPRPSLFLEPQNGDILRYRDLPWPSWLAECRWGIKLLQLGTATVLTVKRVERPQDARVFGVSASHSEW